MFSQESLSCAKKNPENPASILFRTLSECRNERFLWSDSEPLFTSISQFRWVVCREPLGEKSRSRELHPEGKRHEKKKKTVSLVSYVFTYVRSNHGSCLYAVLVHT